MSCLIKKANNDIFQRSPRSNKPPSRIIRPFELNGEGEGLALVLRYSGCNLRCPLCYAWKYAWRPRGYSYQLQNVVSALRNLAQAVNNIRTKIRIKNKKIVWVRIQGGEPFLNFNRTLFTIEVAAEALKIIYNYKLNYYNNTRAVIQTNGILFSDLSKDEIDQIRECLHEKAVELDELNHGRIIFEISFKLPHNLNNVLNRQLGGFYTLLNQVFKPIWNEGLDNVALYPVAGLGPSIDLHNTYIIPVDPYYLSQREVPLFHQSTWSDDFQQLFNNFTNNIVQKYSAYKDFRKNPQTNGGRKIAIEELEPSPFQTAWISGYAGAYGKSNVKAPPIDRILRRLDNCLDPEWICICCNKKNNKIIVNKSWIKVLSNIPVSGNPQNLLNQVRRMSKFFYSSHPIQHYPYL